MSIILHGVAIGGGIAIGRAHLISRSMDDVAHYLLEDDEVPAEKLRFDEAVRATRKELEMLWGSIPENAPAELGAFLSLHIMLLGDVTISREPREIIEKQRCNAEWALKLQCDHLIEQFDAIEEDYLRERKNDVLQVVERIFTNLDGDAPQLPAPEDLVEDHILVAHDLSPADMVYFKDSNFAAFITDVGGATSHTAILGRSLDLPSVIALHHGRELIRQDEMIIVDGLQGVVIINPDALVLAEYRRRLRAWRGARRKLSSIRKSSAVTRDGAVIELLANIERPQDVDDVRESGAVGIGLFRSEFLFLGRDTLPTEDEQFQAYRHVAAAMKGMPVTIRTMDLGADKSPKWLTHDQADNPALGLTGIRLCLAEPLMFRAQLRALLRASVHGRIRVLFPMVNSLPELKQALAQFEYAKEELRDEGIGYADDIEVGAMIEIPSAALVAGSFTKHVDFLSIGTNDLIQYTLAIDRNDDTVSHLYDPVHPAVLKLILHTIKCGIKANVPVSVCGEMAGDAKLTRLLLGMGLRKFSMHPANLLSVKQQVLTSHLDEIAPIAARMLRSEDPDKIADLLQLLNAEPGE
ncbi:phosphoenolpyruvate--protein phosphotransferase [Chromobacterium amazonense]|uniref:Phosphoenolpyruvate-protein phosphotransferase n=3 Tax=Chromobacterium amazonense TaxID=1382803 RepID=A0A2S9X9B7_9NEIS|nr:phosphoenolpyruvate--protein phosphotransferase [Chromobacterium amazonense]KIA79057.1 phosphoenolpyruvate-protein phosphotransferase [Chromobacterium piscinae]MDQ4540769.1 phosphoenolpyruvate--protein phosphotransferase [Chromobacterium amazonense]PRP72167.1 phosphoenolpyruvate--protein phosphotransferase [Chromobacterium amazonense]